MSKRRRNRYLPIGEISSGTMRPEDLIPDFLYELKRVAPVKARAYQKEYDAVPEDDPEGIADEILNGLFDVLEEYTPPFFYFGSNEGDGACYGVWLYEDSFAEARHDGEVWTDPDDGSRMPKSAQYRLVISDHGNMTLYYRNGREAWGIV